MADIHPTAIVDEGARLADGVSLGPWCVVGGDVELAAGVRLLSHVVVSGRTSIGRDSVIHPFASIGGPPQDLKYAGEPSRLVVGARNVVREHVTMNPGTAGGGMETAVGDDCLFMVGSHVAHDCRIGNRVVLANNATLAGHVAVGDHAILGGLTGVHQHVRIGAHAMVGGMAGVEHDVPPFALVSGNRARIDGLNIVGMRRHGFARREIDALRAAFDMLFAGEGGIYEKAERVRSAYPDSEGVARLAAFVAVEAARPLCRLARADAA